MTQAGVLQRLGPQPKCQPLAQEGEGYAAAVAVGPPKQVMEEGDVPAKD